MTTQQQTRNTLPFKALLAAGMGGVLPSLIRLANDLQRGKELPNSSFILGFLLTLLIGAFTCYFLGEIEPKKAFLLGISLPSLVASLAGSPAPPSQSDENLTPKDVVSSLLDIIEPSAHAREESGDQFANEIYVTSSGAVSSYEVEFQLRSGLEGRLIVPGGTRSEVIKRFDVPEKSDFFRVRVGGAWGERHSLRIGESEIMTCHISVTENIWSGLFRAVGFPSEKFSLKETKISTTELRGRYVTGKKTENYEIFVDSYMFLQEKVSKKSEMAVLGVAIDASAPIAFEKNSFVLMASNGVELRVPARTDVLSQDLDRVRWLINVYSDSRKPFYGREFSSSENLFVRRIYDLHEKEVTRRPNEELFDFLYFKTPADFPGPWLLRVKEKLSEELSVIIPEEWSR